MLHIILTILKIIGITLLVILGIIIALLLIILLVPIRYDIKASKDDKIHVNATIHWILHIITCRYLLDNGSDFYIKIFGIKLMNSQKAKHNDDGLKEKKDKAPKKQKEEPPVPEKELTSKGENTNISEPNIAIEEISTSDSKFSFIKKKTEAFKKKIQDIKEKTRSALNNIKKKTTYFFDMLEDESNKKAINKVWKSIKRLIKAILPKKHKIYVKYGKEDPASLADIIGYVAILKSATDLNITFEPVFDENILEFNIRFKGKLQLILILILAIKLYKDKDIRKFIKNFTD